MKASALTRVQLHRPAPALTQLCSLAQAVMFTPTQLNSRASGETHLNSHALAETQLQSNTLTRVSYKFKYMKRDSVLFKSSEDRLSYVQIH